MPKVIQSIRSQSLGDCCYYKYRDEFFAIRYLETNKQQCTVCIYCIKLSICMLLVSYRICLTGRTRLSTKFYTCKLKIFASTLQ